MTSDSEALLALAQNQGVSVERVSREELGRLVEGRHQGAVARVAASDAESGAGCSGASRNYCVTLRRKRARSCCWCWMV